VIKLLHDVGISLWLVIVSAWTQIFKIPDINLLGLRATVVSITITLVSLVIIIGVLFAYRESLINKKTYLAILFLGLLACMLGGIPWWLTELLPSLVFPNDRFTLTFMLGVCMVIVGLLGILPIPSWIRILTIATLVAFAIGSQFMVVYQFRRDWALQTRFFWQLAWRMPEIKPGTTIMVNELPVTYYSDNSLTAPLNWIWAPSNNSQQLAYLLLYPSQRMGGSLTSLNPGTPISEDYLVANFRGNTSQTVAIYY
jgi:hypothetical protein